MARFDTSGIDGIINEVIRLGKAGQEVGDKMLLAGAEKVEEAWKFAAGMHGLIDTRDMVDSVGFHRRPKNVGSIRTIDIYPQGTDRKGVRNAEKAFIHHYGSSKHKATHWVDDADEKAGSDVQAVMEKVFDDFMNGKE